MQHFQIYHPYLTFCDLNNTDFISEKAGAMPSESEDTQSLFFLARQAYLKLPNISNQSDFDDVINNYIKAISSFRHVISEMLEQNALIPSTPFGDHIEVDGHNLTNSQTLSILWEIKSRVPHKDKNESDEFSALFREMFLINTLFEVENALIALDLNLAGVASASIEATNSLANAIAIESGSEDMKKLRSALARDSAFAKLKNDPKQEAKKGVYAYWQRWKSDISLYPSKSAFARDMLEKYDALENHSVITRWCTDWDKEAQ